MKKRAEIVIQVLAACIFTVFIFSVIIFFGNYLAACNALKKLEPASTFESANFYIYGRSENSVSAHFEFFDPYGNSITEIERSWPSENLYIEYIKFFTYGKTVSVPSRIYSSNNLRIQSGVKLKKYLLNVARERKNYYKCLQFLLKPSSRAFTRNIFYTELSLENCETGEYYSLIHEADGSYSIIKLTDLKNSN